jgi:membrane-bound lytic murein transglycosylase A
MMRHILWYLTWSLIVGSLVACSTPRQLPISDGARPSVARPVADAPRATGTLAGTPGTPNPQQSYRSRWVAASWNDVPGWQDDALQDAWNAWLQNCERPGPLFAPLCKDVRQLMLGGDDDRRLWMMSHLQPYRVESLDGATDGLLTS